MKNVTEFKSVDDILKLNKSEMTDEQFFGAMKFFVGEELRNIEKHGGYSEKVKKHVDDLITEANKRLEEKADAIISRAINTINSGDPKKAAEGAMLLTRKALAKFLAASAARDYSGIEKAVEEHDALLEKYGLNTVPMGARVGMTPMEIKASTSAGNTGLVPSTFVPVLVDRLYERSALRKLATVVPVPSSSGKVPGVSAGLTAYHHAEAVAPTESNITSTSISYATEDISALTEVSRKLLVDAMPIGLLNYLLNQVVDAVVV